MVMFDFDVGWCFGYLLGLVWGVLFLGNILAGPFEFLGTGLIFVFMVSCGINVVLVSNNVCAGYRVGCVVRVGANLGEFDVVLCAIFCLYIGFL